MMRVGGVASVLGVQKGVNVQKPVRVYIPSKTLGSVNARIKRGRACGVVAHRVHGTRERCGEVCEGLMVCRRCVVRG